MNLELNKVHNIDCKLGLEMLDDNSVDLIVSSPPYNVSHRPIKSGKILYDYYDDTKEHYEYIAWLKSIFEVAYRKLKTGGRVCLNVTDTRNGKIQTHSDITHFMIHELGYIPYINIIWEKHQVSRRTAWGSYMSPSCPSFPLPYEYILVFAKGEYKLQDKGVSDITRQEFIDWSLPLWRFPGETRQKKIGVLQAMFSKELPYRCIKMFSWQTLLNGEKTLIVDPFAGLATTGKVAKNLGRDFIGFDVSPLYVELGNKRLEAKTDDLDEWLDLEIIAKHNKVEENV